MCLLTCLINETILNENNEQREAQVRRDAQQAVCGLKLWLIEIVRVRQPEVDGRGRLRRDIQPAKRSLSHATRTLFKLRLAIF